MLVVLVHRDCGVDCALPQASRASGRAVADNWSRRHQHVRHGRERWTRVGESGLFGAREHTRTAAATRAGPDDDERAAARVAAGGANHRGAHRVGGKRARKRTIARLFGIAGSGIIAQWRTANVRCEITFCAAMTAVVVTGVREDGSDIEVAVPVNIVNLSLRTKTKSKEILLPESEGL